MSGIDFVICGAMRSGTTWLVRNLARHPEIALLEEDEVRTADELLGFFPFASPSLARAELGVREGTYEAIRRAMAPRARVVGAKRAYFMFYPHVAPNLAEHLPDVKLLFLLRDPVEIGYSAFHHGRRFFREYQDFEHYVSAAADAVGAASGWTERMRWIERFATGGALPLLVERGLYHPQLMRFFRLFPPESIRVLSFADIARAPEASLAGVLAFLGLDPSFRFEGAARAVNAAPAYPPMPAALRERLRELYAGSSRRTLELLGWPADTWGKPPPD